jgi:hypothetical protein
VRQDQQDPGGRSRSADADHGAFREGMNP